MCCGATAISEDVRCAAGFAACLRHSRLVCLCSRLCGVLCRLLFQSAPTVGHYTADYWPGTHTTAFLVVCVNTMMQRKELLETTWHRNIFFFLQNKRFLGFFLGFFFLAKSLLQPIETRKAIRKTHFLVCLNKSNNATQVCLSGVFCFHIPKTEDRQVV